MGGLKDALAHAEGKVTLKTTVLPSPAPAMVPEEVRALREGLKLSQAVFGRLLNVPAVTPLSQDRLVGTTSASSVVPCLQLGIQIAS
jgi:hypothetical protein